MTKQENRCKVCGEGLGCDARLRYCSASCRKQGTRERKRLNEFASTLFAPKPEPKEYRIVCEQCGKEFKTIYRHELTCGYLCRTERKRAKMREYANARRELKRVDNGRTTQTESN